MRKVLLLATLLAPLALSGCYTFHVTPSTWAYPGDAVLAPKALRKLSTSNGYRAQPIYFKDADGTTLHALVLSRPQARVTVLYLGGDNFQTGTQGLPVGKLFESCGVDAVLVDYPGYGGSEGKVGLHNDEVAVLSAFDHLHKLAALHNNPVVVYGFSVGSVFAPYVVSKRQVQGLVLESPATTVKAWAHQAVPWYAVPFVSIKIDPALLSINNTKVLHAYHGPLLLLVGSSDHITPPRFARQLYRAAGTPAADKTLVVAPHRHHGGASNDAGARKALKKFLNHIAGSNASN